MMVLDIYTQLDILTMKIVFYGKRRYPVEKFIRGLPIHERSKVLGCLKSVEELGFSTPRVEFRQLKGKLWEIKINTSSSGIRIFYVMLKQELMVLLHAYKKQSQKAPNKEIEIAEKRMREVLENENIYA